MAYKFNALTGQFDIDTKLGAGTYAPIGAEYVLISADATLTDERVLQVGAGLTLTDGGAGGNATISLTTPIQEIPNRHFVMSLMGA
jgi:hypothetical protein